MGPGWRHSYDRHILTVNTPPNPQYTGQSALISAQYATPDLACSSGFSDIQASVSAWAGATAGYNNGACVLTRGSSTIATLAIQAYPIPAPAATPLEYDVVRDDGLTLRYTLQNGVINSQPEIPLGLRSLRRDSR